MNWDQVEGKWKQLAGSLKEKFGKLTDDDLKVVAGKKEHAIGKLQELYGHSRAEAETHLDAWTSELKDEEIPTSTSGAPTY